MGIIEETVENNGVNIKNINSNNKGVLNIKMDCDVEQIISTCHSIGAKACAQYERGLYKNLAKDIVATNLNDLACYGAKAIGLTSYLMANNLDKNKTSTLIHEIETELLSYDCSYSGSRIKEYNDIIKENHIDLGTFSVGINPIKKEKIVSGDIIIALVSNGIHNHGFETVQKLYKNGELTEDEYIQCLEPSYNYYNEILDLYNKSKIKDCVSIKGSITQSLNKIIPRGLTPDLNLKHIPPQPIFEKLHELCSDDFYDTFNAGIGVCLIAERASNELFFEDTAKFNPFILGVIK